MPFLSHLIKYTFVTGVVGGVSLIATLVPAQAGFDWTPPPVQQKPVVQPQPESVSQLPSAIQPLTPELDSLPVPVVDAMPIAPEPVVKADLPVPGMKTLPVKAVPDVPAVAPSAPVTLYAKMPVDAPSVPSRAVEPVAPSVVSSAPSSDNLEGFGKDIPLALALRDIVPSSYAYAFGSGDLAGLKISWRGGKPWKQVLDTALTPLNLKADIQGNVVMIYSHSAVAAAPAPVIAPAPVVSQEAAPAPTSAPLSLSSTIDATPVPPPAVTPPVARSVDSGRGVPVVDLTVKRQWNARSGSTLRQVLEGWCKESNVELNWSTAYDYPINNAFYFEGTYGEAVDSLLSSYGGETPAPKGRLYPNLPDGPSVLMIN